jgi:hypothetical protein
MRWLARAALAALSSFVSVFIACAYGTPWRYVKSGRVVGAGTSVGIPGIQAGCALGGGLAAVATTDAEGLFTLHIDDTCDELRFSDVDGAANGAYQQAVLPFVAADETELLVELTPVP